MTEKTDVLKRLCKSYVNALVEGNRVQATAIVREGLKASASPFSVYLDILSPAQAEIGDLWSSGQINIAQEHWATEVTFAIMEDLKRSIEPQRDLGLRAVVTSIEGDLHNLGARMVAHFLHFDGWDVDFLGADTPVQDLVEFVRRTRPELVAISLTLEDGFNQLIEAVEKIRQLPFETRILVGGPAIWTEAFELIRSDLDIDGTARDALEAIQSARALMGVSGKAQSLDMFLQHVGSRIQQTRKSKGWSQKELGDSAGLDRTYISAVEHGKQNLTLGALKRLADALDVSIEALISNNGLGDL